MRGAFLLGTMVLIAVLVFPVAAATQSPDDPIRIPAWVFERCNRYPAFFVSASGTLIVFYTRDEKGICAAVVRPREGAAESAVLLRESVTQLRLVFARFGCWIVSPSYESVVPGSQGVVIVARCERDARIQQFLIGVHDGMLVIGYRLEW
jgi:hypothetical protein